MIQCYDDFARALLRAGFSFAYSSNSEGIYSLLQFNWNDEPEGSALCWFTGDPDHDPAAWCARLLTERGDIAYAKLFFNKAGYITKEWYPYFFAARRQTSLDAAYSDGLISQHAKLVYDHLREHGPTPAHELKFGKADKAKYERGLVELQMGLFVTVCGERKKISRKGEAYGWPANVFCTVEEFWPREVFAQAALISPEEAGEAIARRVFELNPEANAKKVRKFILGR